MAWSCLSVGSPVGKNQLYGHCARQEDGMTFARKCRDAPSTWCKRIESRRPCTDALRCWVAGRGRFVSFSLTRLGWGGEGGGAGSFSLHRPSCCCTSSLLYVLWVVLLGDHSPRRFDLPLVVTAACLKASGFFSVRFLVVGGVHKRLLTQPSPTARRRCLDCGTD